MKSQCDSKLIIPCAVLGLSGVSAAFAQEVPSTVLDEITVTVHKREERLQDVPAAVTAFSAEKIEEAGIVRPKDFAGMTPNFMVYESQNAGNVAIVLRGIGQVRNGNPPVAVLEDGVLQMSPNQFNQELYDIERIEILRGPQGALYGRNAIAGAVSIITRQPTNTTEGRIRLGYANGDDFSFGAAASGALVDDVLLFRVAGSYRNMDGLLYNPTQGREVDGYEDSALRGRLIFKPRDTLSIDLRAAYSRFDGGAFYYVAVPDGHPNDTDGTPTFNHPSENERTVRDLSLKIDWDVGFATLSSITAYNDLDEFFTGDLDFSELNMMYARQTLAVESISQELRLTSPDDRRLRWIAGVYVLDTDRRLVTFGEADFDAFLGAPDGIIDGPFLDVNDFFDIRCYAAFGQLSYDLSDAFELALAMRYDDETTEQHTPGQPSRKISFDKLQPKVILRYKPSSRTVAYASYAEGFRGGGLNSSAAPEELRLWKAEESRNYELGLKSTLLDGRLTFNTAVFYTKFDDQQIFILDVGPDALGQLGRNIDETDLKGIEMELAYRPTPYLELNAGLGAMRSRIRKFAENPQYVGNESPKVPERELTFGIQGFLPLGADTHLVARADYQHVGEMAWHVDNVDMRDPVNIVNLRLTLRHRDWSVSLWGKNVFDESFTDEFYAREFSGFTADNYFPDRGRRYGLEVTRQF